MRCRALDAGAALLASEQVGLARWCLEATVDYLRVRKQFGRPLGGFQALKYRLSDLYASVESAAAAARYESATLAEGDSDEPVAASLAGLLRGYGCWLRRRPPSCTQASA